MAEYHSSVLLREAVGALGVKKDKWYLDCTLGDGGHSLEILKQGGKVLGLDVDPQALDRAGVRLQGAAGPRRRGGGQDFRLILGNFRDLKTLIQQQMDPPVGLAGTKGSKFAGVTFDLGVSSLQLESPERGFSFVKSGPLDMRMDPTLQIKALDLVNNLSGKELYEIFQKLGEEKYSKRLANALVSARQVAPFTTTKQLAEVVVRVVGGIRGRIPAHLATRSVAGRHPATRVFQALRIVVNDELYALKEGLEQVKDLIEKNGTICVISFHSLEDRIVKVTFREWEDGGLGEILTKKPVIPSQAEVILNPRSRSAKLRAFKYYEHH